MPTSPSPISTSPPLAERPTAPSPPAGETFARLLADYLRPADFQTNSDSSSALPGFPWDGVGQAEQILSLGLASLIERLLSSAYSAQRAAPAGLPVAGRLSQGYHAGHRALDIAVPAGTPVQATMAGRVVYAGWNDEGYGNLVIVANGPYRTYYAHLDRVLVKASQSVDAGALVGFSGNTGNSTGPHLHYEVRVNGERVMPGDSIRGEF
ncbi:MAG: M23 family metallopeptidase [Chloroflexi bacterium]|nr:M23 family metallopeptidase [Chloroflexota bacterium]